MNDQSGTCEATTCAATPSVTSSPGSGSGAMPCAAPDGPTTDRSGPGPAPVSPSARRGRASASPMIATSGPNSFGSLRSAGLTSSLVNRLQARTRGSILYRLTWKLSATPSGLLTYRLRASAASISDSGATGWPTPTTPSGGQSAPLGTTATGRRPDGSKATVTLAAVSSLAGWPTPCVVEPDTDPEKVWARKQRLTETTGVYRGNDCGLGSKAHLAGWNTPRATDGSNGGPGQTGGALPADAAMAGWGTPACRDHKDGEFNPNVEINGLLGRQVWLADGPARLERSGQLLTGSSAGMEGGGPLRPGHSRWLQRLPAAWDYCGVTAMLSMQKSRRSS